MYEVGWRRYYVLMAWRRAYGTSRYRGEPLLHRRSSLRWGPEGVGRRYVTHPWDLWRAKHRRARCRATIRTVPVARGHRLVY